MADLIDVGEQLFAMRPVRVVFHLRDGREVEATVTGWQLDVKRPNQAVATITTADAKPGA